MGELSASEDEDDDILANGDESMFTTLLVALLMLLWSGLALLMSLMPVDAVEIALTLDE